MRFLTHPAMIPLLSYAFIIELERQSYSINISYVLMIVAYAGAMLWICDFFVNRMCRKADTVNRPLTHYLTPLKPRLLVAAMFTVIFTCLTVATQRVEYIYTWGDKYIFSLFILPTWMNVLSGEGIRTLIPSTSDTFIAKTNIAPAAYIGALSALVIMVGYKTGNDTFWPFVITLMLFTLEAHFSMKESGGGFLGPIFSYLLGSIQAFIIMFIFA
ncbi:MAG: hypothetical protein MJZ66_10755 [Bacteroidales bacterium]|nr:hypothetical protein [Bacteroidales bacterium]